MGSDHYLSGVNLAQYLPCCRIYPVNLNVNLPTESHPSPFILLPFLIRGPTLTRPVILATARRQGEWLLQTMDLGPKASQSVCLWMHRNLPHIQNLMRACYLLF